MGINNINNQCLRQLMGSKFILNIQQLIPKLIMTKEEIAMWTAPILLAIIGYFFRKLHTDNDKRDEKHTDDMGKIKEELNIVKTDLKVLENSHSTLEKRFEKDFKEIKELLGDVRGDIKQLAKDIAQRK